MSGSQVERAERKAWAAERRIIRTMRAWYRTFSPSVDQSFETAQDRMRRHGRFILALGLDEEAQNELRAAKRRSKR